MADTGHYMAYYGDIFKVLIMLSSMILVLSGLFYYGLSGESTYLGYKYVLQQHTINETILDGRADAAINIIQLERTIKGEESEAYININATNNNGSIAKISLSIFLEDATPSSINLADGTTGILEFEMPEESVFTAESTLSVYFLSDKDGVVINSLEIYYPYAIYDASIERVVNAGSIGILLAICLFLVGNVFKQALK